MFEDQFDSQIDPERHPELAAILASIELQGQQELDAAGQEDGVVHIQAVSNAPDLLTPELYHTTLAEFYLRPDVS